MMKTRIKIQHPVTKTVNGNEYRGARLSLRISELENIGIDEDNPYVDIEYDEYGRKIVITPAE